MKTRGHIGMRLLQVVTTLYYPLTISFLLAATLASAAPVVLENALTVSTSLPMCSNTSDAVVVFNLLTYLVSNYGIHAAAVPLGAELAMHAPQVTRRRRYVWAAWMIILSLLLPFATSTRSMLLIIQQYQSEGNSIVAALYHGALLVVVRAKNWKPSTQPETVYAKLPQLMLDTINER